MPSLNDTAYPRLKSNPSPDALETLYSPTPEEQNLAQRVTRGEVSRLGFVVLLKTFQTLGYPVQLSQVPERIVTHIAKTLELSQSPEALASYDASGSRRRHLSVIREYLQIKPFAEAARQAMTEAMEEAVKTHHDLVDLINIALEELVRQRYELPGFTTLMQAARDIRAASSEARFQAVFQALDASQRAELNALFYVPQGEFTWSTSSAEKRKMILIWTSPNQP